MKPPDYQERIIKNDQRVRELAEISIVKNFPIFGLQDLAGIPSGIRLRLKAELNGHTPLSQEAWVHMRKGDSERAQQIFEQCLKEGDADDERFFSVHWGMGQIARKNKKPNAAVSYFREGVMKFPEKVREQHFLEIIELILELNPQAETDAAAVALHGIKALQIDPSKILKSKEVGYRLQQKFQSMEVQKIGSPHRPFTFKEILDRYAEPIDGKTRRFIENEPSKSPHE